MTPSLNVPSNVTMSFAQQLTWGERHQHATLQILQLSEKLFVQWIRTLQVAQLCLNTSSHVLSQDLTRDSLAFSYRTLLPIPYSTSEKSHLRSSLHSAPTWNWTFHPSQCRTKPCGRICIGAGRNCGPLNVCGMVRCSGEDCSDKARLGNQVLKMHVSTFKPRPSLL